MASVPVGTSGIRGKYPQEVSIATAILLARALLTAWAGAKIGLGHDTRKSSPLLHGALCGALVAGGCTVEDYGLAPTPAISYQVRCNVLTGGVVVTASHNPPKYNGLKVLRSDGSGLTKEELITLLSSISPTTRQTGNYERVKPQDYLELLQNLGASSADIAFDFMKGAVAALLPPLLPSSAIRLNETPSSEFPHGRPEPSPEALQDLAAIVRNRRCIGVGFDGDGDRAVFVDEKGRVPDQDRVLALYAAYLAEQTGKPVVTSFDASIVIEQAVEQSGGKVFRAPVGDPYISIRVRETNAVLGGEPCGAWIHPEYHLGPDGPVTALKVLSWLRERRIVLADALDALPTTTLLRGKLKCDDVLKQAAMSEIANQLIGSFGEEAASTEDGVWLRGQDWWLLVRPSGTEPIIRISVEAFYPERAKALYDKVFCTVQAIVQSLASRSPSSG